MNTNEYEIQETKLNIHIQIIGKFYTILLNKERLKIATQNVNNREIQYQQTQNLYDIGKIPFKDINEIKANLIQDKQAQQSEKINVENSKLDLAHFLQINDYKSFDISQETNHELNSLYSINQIIDSNLDNHPIIKVNESKVEESLNEMKYIKTQLFPKITLNHKISSSFQYFFDHNNLLIDKQLINNFSNIIYFGVQIPIFNQGNIKNQIQQSKINHQIILNKFEQDKILIKNQIEKIYFDLIYAQENYILAQESEKVNQTAYQFAEKSFEIGKINLYELNISRNNYLIAQLKTVQTKYEILFKQKTLELFSN